jgi:predicted GNAT superfamily acetyltransferase
MVEASHDHEDYAKYEALRNEVWGFPEDYLPGPRNLMCENFLHDGSALFIAAYSEHPGGKVSDNPAYFVGFAYGFVGVKDKDVAFHSRTNLWFYSQYTGVKEAFRDCSSCCSRVQGRRRSSACSPGPSGKSKIEENRKR